MISSTNRFNPWLARAIGGLLIPAWIAMMPGQAPAYGACAVDEKQPAPKKSDEGKADDKKSDEKETNDAKASDQKKTDQDLEELKRRALESLRKKKATSQPTTKPSVSLPKSSSVGRNGRPKMVSEGLGKSDFQAIRDAQKAALEARKNRKHRQASGEIDGRSRNGKTPPKNGSTKTLGDGKPPVAPVGKNDRKITPPVRTRQRGQKLLRPGQPRTPVRTSPPSTLAPRTGATPTTGSAANPAVKTPAAGAGTAPASANAGDSSSSYEGATKSPVTQTQTTTEIYTMGKVPPESRTYRFQYHKTPWMDVLEDFSRVSGLPLMNLSDAPIPGECTFYSEEEFTFVEALHKLNEALLLQPMNNVLITRDPTFLKIQRLPDLLRKIPPEKMFNTFEEFEAANLDPYDICLTQYKTPSGWPPFQIIESFRDRGFSDTYGTTISGTDTIELTGLVKEHLLFKEVIGKLTESRPPPVDDNRPRLEIKLKNARVSDVQGILNQLYSVRASAVPKTRGRPTPGGIDLKTDRAKQLTLVPDIKKNIIYARGPQALLDEIMRTVENIDRGPGWKPQVREVVPLEHASASTIVATLKPILQKEQQSMMKSQRWIPPELKDALACDLIPNVSGNTIILVGGDEGVARGKRLVQQYDVAPNWITEIIELAHAEAVDVAGELMQAMPRSVGKRAQPSQYIARTSKTILVSCSKPNYQRVLELIAKLDVPNHEKPSEHFVHLECARPSEISQTMGQLVKGVSTTPVRRRAPVKRKGVKRPSPRVPNRTNRGGGTGPTLIPDDGASMLIVYCSDAEWAKIEPLAKQLDDLACEAKPLMHKVALENAMATDVADMINQMFPPEASSTNRIVTADTFNNTVNLFASQAFIDQVLPLIKQLDIVDQPIQKVIRLQWAKAEVLEPILQQSVPGGSASPSRAPRIVTKRGKRVKVPARRTTGGGNSSVRIVAEPITNVLLVTAPPKELAIIQDLVAEMEEKAKEKIPTRVILIAENRPAQELADVVTSLMSGGTSMRRGPKGKKTPMGVNPVAEPMKIVTSGEQIILDGPQDEVAEAIQIINIIDVVDQRPIVRKVKVRDAAEDANKLRAMLAAGGASKAKPRRRVSPGKGGKGQKVQKISIPTAASAPIQISEDTYENTLLISAMPKDWIRIDEILTLILSDPDIPDVLKGQEEYEPFFMVDLRYKEAWELEYLLEDLVNVDERSKVQFIEGPTKRQLLVRNFRPAQREMIEQYITMYDVPEGKHFGGRDDILFIDLKGKMAASQAVKMIQQNFQSPSGAKISVGNIESEGRVRVIDIHAGEEDEEEEEAGVDKNTPQVEVDPCVLPASLLRAVCSLSLAQEATDKPTVRRRLRLKSMRPD
ncbi:MAG: secretin N-terminal domain-containing protein, partial [Phycisphaerae bacterium]